MINEKLLNSMRVPAVVLTGALALGACSSGGENSPSGDAKVDARDANVGTSCDVAAWNVDRDYRANIDGAGIVATINSTKEKDPKHEEVVREVAEELGGNTLGTALLEGALSLQENAVAADQLLGRVEARFTELSGDDAKRKQACENIAGRLLESGEVRTLVAPEVITISFAYDGNALKGVSPSKEGEQSAEAVSEGSGNAQKPIEVVTIPDESGGVRFGISTETGELVFPVYPSEAGAEGETPKYGPEAFELPAGTAAIVAAANAAGEAQTNGGGGTEGKASGTGKTGATGGGGIEGKASGTGKTGTTGGGGTEGKASGTGKTGTTGGGGTGGSGGGEACSGGCPSEGDGGGDKPAAPAPVETTPVKPAPTKPDTAPAPAPTKPAPVPEPTKGNELPVPNVQW
jgi:hypothetical protein